MADSRSEARNIQDDLKYLDIPERKKRPFRMSEDFGANLKEIPIGQIQDNEYQEG